MLQPHRRGTALVYLTVLLVIFAAFCSLAVDYGQVHMTKAQLQRTADAAARAGASGIRTSAARIRAGNIAAQNRVNGEMLGLNTSTDVTIGNWNKVTNVFTTATGFNETTANAVRVIVGRGVPMTYAKLLGFDSCNVQATAIALITPDKFQVEVKGTTNPYMSGMPPETRGIVPDGQTIDVNGVNAWHASVNGMEVIPGSNVTFSAKGGVANDPAGKLQPPDGQVNAKRMFTKWQNQPEHGMSSIIAPPNCLIGVFISDARPDQSPPPMINVNACPSDYSKQAARDRSSYNPQLKQIFYIGDGKNSFNQTQQFIVPPGATRLFLGTMDEWEWNNNKGSFDTTINGIARIITVK